MRTACPSFQKLVPPDFACPACGKRPTDRTVVLHHDHIEDAIADRANQLPRPPNDFNDLTLLILAVRRFQPTLICDRCNALDAILKQNVVGAEAFSLSPSLMASIDVTTKPSKSIGCMSAWTAARPDHERRIDAVNRMLPLFVKGLHAGSVPPPSTMMGKSGAREIDKSGSPLPMLAEVRPDAEVDLVRFEISCWTMRYKAIVSRYKREFRLRPRPGPDAV